MALSRNITFIGGPLHGKSIETVMVSLTIPYTVGEGEEAQFLKGTYRAANGWRFEPEDGQPLMVMLLRYPDGCGGHYEISGIEDALRKIIEWRDMDGAPEPCSLIDEYGVEVMNAAQLWECAGRLIPHQAATAQ